MENNDYTALTIVSPLQNGEDSKDQDRARFYESGQIACVCDGVTNSPDSEKGAELIKELIPAIFQKDIPARLEMLCDLLKAKRQESLLKEVHVSSDIPPAMHDTIKRIIHQKREFGFQSTLVAAKLTTKKNNVLAKVLKCGDSAFFAFSPVGQLLSSTLHYDNSETSNSRVKLIGTPEAKAISFGPGDDILVRVEGLLSKHKTLAQNADINSEHAQNWLLCTPLDSCKSQSDPDTKNFTDLKVLRFTSKDLLLVPKYLYGRTLTSDKKIYHNLYYSSSIKPIYTGKSATINRFSNKGSATKVLPDHFYNGNYDLYQDSFPLGTNFLLCSDGFYSCFDDWPQLWNWLSEHNNELQNEETRESVLKQLHLTLFNKCGDDDISFVWATPGKENHSCQQK